MLKQNSKGDSIMKKIFIATLLLLLAATCYAGQKAITDTGEQVILNSDGTWVYADKTGKKPEQKIETNKASFQTPKGSNFLLKSSRNNSAYWINPEKWTFKKTKENASAEYSFQLKGKDLYAMAITEGIEIPLDTFAEIAVSNARDAASNATLARKEYRVVNGKKVIYLEINGTIKGIDFSYLGYYYSNAAGSTQFVTYTSTKALDKYRSEMIDFLNGLDAQ
jgi:hypothetical protein